MENFQVIPSMDSATALSLYNHETLNYNDNFTAAKSQLHPQLTKPTSMLKKLSREEWEDLKPIIKHLYIDSNQTFEQVKLTLTLDYQFAPTKRQFTRRLEEWGFRKNAKTDGICSSLQCVGNQDRAVATSKVSRIVKTYSCRGPQRKVFRRESYTSPRSILTANATDQGTVLRSVVKCTLKTQEMHNSPQSEFVPLPKSYQDEEMPAISSELADPWPFNWASVDIPNSPGLTRLFERLDLECHNDIPDLDLDDTQNNRLVCPTEKTTSLPLLCENRRPHSLGSRVNQLYACNDNQRMSHFTTGMHGELSIFPTNLEKAPSSAVNGRQKRLRWPAATLERVEKLLDRQNTNSIPHYFLFNSLKEVTRLMPPDSRWVEYVCRKSLVAIQSRKDAKRREVLGVSLLISMALRMQARYKDAYEIQQVAKLTIVNEYDPEDPLNIWSMKEEALCLGHLGFTVEAERILREVLQQQLISYGPWNVETRKCFGLLSSVINLQQTKDRRMEAERLILISLDACQATNDFEVFYFRDLQYLSGEYHSRGFHNESKSLLNRATDLAIRVFGEEHPVACGIAIKSAIGLYHHGLSKECVELCRQILQRGTMWHTELTQAKTNVMELLSINLCTIGQYDEGTTLLERTFHTVQLLNLPLKEVMRLANNLGRCYESQGRYCEAVKHFELTMSYIRNSTHYDDTESSIQALENRAKWCENYIAGECRESNDWFPIAEEMELESEEGNENKNSSNLGSSTGEDTDSSSREDIETDDDLWDYINFPEDASPKNEPLHVIEDPS